MLRPIVDLTSSLPIQGVSSLCPVFLIIIIVIIIIIIIITSFHHDIDSNINKYIDVAYISEAN